MVVHLGFAYDEKFFEHHELLQIKRIGAIQETLAKQLLDKTTYDGLPPLRASDDD